MIDDESKEVWITKYGVHADTLEKTVRITSALADYAESVANISLPQVLYRKSPDYYPTAPKKYFSLLTSPDGAGLTKLGEMFRDRVEKRLGNNQE